jgi:hypothetical protein
MAAQCRPRPDKAAVKDAVTYSKKMKRMTDQTIADWLGMTPAESEILEGLPPARTFRPANESSPGPRRREPQRAAIGERRAAIQAIITAAGTVPTVRDMSTMLKTKGHPGSHQTVFKDYKALGINCERTRGAVAEEN